jgi:hypothetical protein
MKSARFQLELELHSPQQKCRSVRRARKPTPSRVWFQKMRQVVDEAADRPVTEAAMELDKLNQP